MSSGELAGRAALVTGAASGIGRAVAERLEQARMEVLAVDPEPGPDGPGVPYAADLTGQRPVCQHPAVLPKVVACDLDGTLLRSDGTVSERARRAIAAVETAGSVLVLCTARPARWMRPLADALGHRGLAICANGAVVWDLHREEMVECFELAPEVTRDLVALLEGALPGGSWAVERTSGFGREPSYYSRWPVPDGTEVAPVGGLIAQPAVKLMLRHPSLLADALLERAREVVGHRAELSHSNSSDGLLEISAAGVTKATTLAWLCALLGIGARDVLAFGDMPNDLPMLQWAGRSVAVGNAHREVLGIVDEVTAVNDEDGVAVVLERIFAAGELPRAPRARRV